MECPYTFKVLRAIHTHPRSTHDELCALFEYRNGKTITVALQNCRKHGWIVREVEKQKRRYSLSDKGHTVLGLLDQMEALE